MVTVMRVLTEVPRDKGSAIVRFPCDGPGVIPGMHMNLRPFAIFFQTRQSSLTDTPRDTRLQ